MHSVLVTHQSCDVRANRLPILKHKIQMLAPTAPMFLLSQYRGNPNTTTFVGQFNGKKMFQIFGVYNHIKKTQMMKRESQDNDDYLFLSSPSYMNTMTPLFLMGIDGQHQCI